MDLMWILDFSSASIFKLYICTIIKIKTSMINLICLMKAFKVNCRITMYSDLLVCIPVT